MRFTWSFPLYFQTFSSRVVHKEKCTFQGRMFHICHFTASFHICHFTAAVISQLLSFHSCCPARLKWLFIHTNCIWSGIWHPIGFWGPFCRYFLTTDREQRKIKFCWIVLPTKGAEIWNDRSPGNGCTDWSPVWISAVQAPVAWNMC